MLNAAPSRQASPKNVMRKKRIILFPCFSCCNRRKPCFHKTARLPTTTAARRLITSTPKALPEAEHETRPDRLHRYIAAVGQRRGAGWRQGHFKNHDQSRHGNAGRRLSGLWRRL